MDIMDILEMKKDASKSESDNLIKVSLVKVIFDSIRVEGEIAIKRDLDKDHIRRLMESAKDNVRCRYINPLKPYITPDTYMEVNELLAKETGDAIKTLCDMYDQRHEFFDLIKNLKEILGGEDDED